MECGYCKKPVVAKHNIYCDRKCFGKSQIGKKLSVEHRLKIGRKGRIPWNKGLHVGGNKRVLSDKNCDYCRKIFRPRDSGKRFCSRACCYKKKPHRGKIIQCGGCRKNIYQYPRDRFRKRGFCNRICRRGADHGGKIIRKCRNCNAKYRTSKSHVLARGSNYCSMKCFNEYRGKNYVKQKRRKNLPLQKSKKYLWTIFSRYIRQRDGGVCISCGRQNVWQNMDAGHYVPKTAGLSLYFDEKNVHCQCTYCNRFLHGNLSQYALALRKKYGSDILEEMEQKRRKITRFSERDYETMIILYKNKLRDLINEAPPARKRQCGG